MEPAHIIHKTTHTESGRVAYLCNTACGTSIMKSSQTWNNVTCSRCLAKKTKESGWFGNTRGHKRTGRLAGNAPHKKRGLQAATLATRQAVGRLGGLAKARNKK